MKRLGRDADLDESAVRNAERHAADWRRPPTRGPRAASNPVTVVTVHPEVWAAALDLANGRASHIEVHSAENVTVHNGPWRTTKKKGIPS